MLLRRLAPWGAALSALGLACCLFGLLGSLALMGFGILAPEADAARSVIGLALRTGGFLMLGSILAWTLVRCLSIPRPEPTPPQTDVVREQPTALAWTLFGVGMLLALHVTTHALADYPWAAPDETHHLGVVRNLAVHGVYASGHPEAGFNYFDPYDSVGAPVMFAGALAWRMADGGLAAPRLAIALQFMALLLCLAWLMRSDPWAAALTPWVATAAYSSIYLARTFYGEVPAMLFLALGIVLWSQASGPRRVPQLAAAGLMFGLAVLCKPLFATLACCGAVALALDAWQRRTLAGGGGANLMTPLCLGAGAAAPLLAWGLFQAIHTPEGHVETRSMAGIYQHYLLFGIEPIAGNLRRLWSDHPAADLIAAAAYLWWGGTLFARRTHPAMLFLWMAGGFFAWWWLCFTPGQLTRYLWPAYLVAALGAAATVPRIASAPRDGWPEGLHRLRDLLIVALLFYPQQWLLSQTSEVWNNREMRAYAPVLEALRALPPDATVASTDYPLRGIAHVLTNRWIEGGEDPVRLLASHDALVLRGEDEVSALAGYPHVAVPAGGYWIVTKPSEP
ncbi:MAG: hypothetical protein RLZZ303_2227 [Candidatus Hydrogenedentota bacterium]|jgi:hypothetical protein